jgi:hypothetical protein
LKIRVSVVRFRPSHTSGPQRARKYKEPRKISALVLPEALKREVCNSFDAAAATRVPRKRAHLAQPVGRPTRKQRLPGMGQVPVYHFKPPFLADEPGGL